MPCKRQQAAGRAFDSMFRSGASQKDLEQTQEMCWLCRHMNAP